MAIRLVLAVAVLAALGIAFLLWRRPSRRLAAAELIAAGVQGPAVVEFVTATCAPCRAVAPALHAAATAAGVPFAQIDVGVRPDLARRYGIRSVPTVAVTGPGGRVIDVWTTAPLNGEVAEAARRARALGR